MELIDIYNDSGEQNGITEEKYEVHRKGLLHKSICVWIMNSNNEILFQKRSPHVMAGNLLDVSYSGHIRSGESALEAVLREGKEELGIQVECNKLQYIFSCRVYSKLDEFTENEIDDVYLYRADIPIEQYKFCDNEVQSVVYVPLAEFKCMVEKKDDSLIPYELQYRYLLDFLESSLYKK